MQCWVFGIKCQVHYACLRVTWLPLAMPATIHALLTATAARQELVNMPARTDKLAGACSPHASELRTAAWTIMIAIEVKHWCTAVSEARCMRSSEAKG